MNSLDELDQWCDGIEHSLSLGHAVLLMTTFLRSARDPSLSTEAKSGLVKVVSLIKAASDGKQSGCSIIVSFPYANQSVVANPVRLHVYKIG